MKTVLFRDRRDKLLAVARVFAPYLGERLLDVGCDTRELAADVGSRYVGLDLVGTPDVRASLEDGLPFRDRSFDTVVAFDVLEHVDRLHAAFDEICRVSRRHVLVGLPNLYEWRFRLSLLLGRGLGGKYNLRPDPPADRHRWVFGLREARDFVRERGRRSGFDVVDEVLGYYLYRRAIPRVLTSVARRLAPRGAAVLAYHYWAALQWQGGST